MRSEQELGRDYRGDTPETGEGDDTFRITKDSPTLPRRDRLQSTRETSLASCEAEGDNTSLASCEARGRHPWPGRHTDGIQRAQPTLAGNRWRQQMPRTATSPRLRRRGERPWPGSTPLRLRRRGRPHFPGQTPTPHTCEAEGDNTSLARYYTFTSAKPRDDPGQARHHTATAHGSASQIQKIVQENTSQIQSENFSTLQPVVNIDKWTTTFSPSPSSRTSSGEAR